MTSLYCYEAVMRLRIRIFFCGKHFLSGSQPWVGRWTSKDRIPPQPHFHWRQGKGLPSPVIYLI